MTIDIAGGLGFRSGDREHPAPVRHFLRNTARHESCFVCALDQPLPCSARDPGLRSPPAGPSLCVMGASLVNVEARERGAGCHRGGDRHRGEHGE